MSSPINTKLLIGKCENAGKTSKNMEDRSECFVAPASGSLGAQVTVAVVADGIGGQAAGEEASRICIETIKAYFLKNRVSEPLKSISSAVEAAHNAILQHKGADPKLAGMGTTMTLAMVISNRVFVASLGDSRAYIVRKNEINQLSEDHTWVQEALVANRISVEEAKIHPNRNILKRYLGMPGTFTLDETREVAFGLGDTLLLCTDGLTDLVEDKELQSTVTSRTPESAAKKLVDRALERGGFDNISVVIVQFPGPTNPALDFKKRIAPLSESPIAIGVIAFVAILLIGFLVFVFFRDNTAFVSQPVPTFDTKANAAIIPTPSVQLPQIASGPTVTPFATFTPAPTSTPYSPPTPGISSPRDGQAFEGNTPNVTLIWTGAELPENVFYVVTLSRSASGAKTQSSEYTLRENRMQVPPREFSSMPAGGEVKFDWNVSIRRTLKVNVDGTKDWDPTLKVPSVNASFVWRIPTPTPTLTSTPLPLPTQIPTKERGGGGPGNPPPPPPKDTPCPKGQRCE
jgi:protein phosphatase